jgi:type IV pilus assembly protein PilZ
MSSGRRVHERYALDLAVTVIHPAGVVTGKSHNVGLGGILLTLNEPLESSSPISFGAEVKLRLFLSPLKEEAEIGGTVRWIKDGAVGIQFGSLRAKEVWAFNQIFRTATPVT